MYYYLFLQTGATPKEYCEMEMGASDLVSADNLNDNVKSSNHPMQSAIPLQLDELSSGNDLQFSRSHSPL